MSASRAIENLFVEPRDRTLGKHASYFGSISVIGDFLIVTLSVVGLHPFRARLDITGVRAKEHFRRLDLLGLLAPEIYLTRRDVAVASNSFGREAPSPRSLSLEFARADARFVDLVCLSVLWSGSVTMGDPNTQNGHENANKSQHISF